MTARSLMRAALPLLILAGLTGCSNVVDPATGQLHGEKMSKAAPESQSTAKADMAPASSDKGIAPEAAAEMDRLRRENQTLKVQQAEAQARLDTLTKQMAQEREEQRRFREMMATNFDLLEQSVAKSLADNMERNGRKPGGEGKTDGKTDTKVLVPGPAMTPPPANADTRPNAAAAPAQAEPGPAALKPMPHWDDDGRETGRAAPPAEFEPKRGDSKRAETAASNEMPSAAIKPAASDSAKMTSAPAKAPAMANRTAAPQAAAAAPVPVVLGADKDGMGKAAIGQDNAGFEDPDLQPPANPRTLTSHPEAKPVYERGFVHLAKGDYDESIRVYEEFLKRFPDDIHSDNAQFWIGEAQMQMKRLDKADAAYRGVLRNFAHKNTLEGYKTPDAIYKIGQIALLKNETRRAEYYFRNVTERFRDSTAGQKAQRELDAIRVNTAAGTGGAVSPDS